MIKIRQFELSDLPKVMKIEKVSFPKRLAYPRSYFLKCFQKFSEGFVVAEVQGKIIGYAIGQLKSRVTAERSAEFISLAVKPEWRQKRIGRKLANFLIKHFKKAGVKEISLNVRTKNKVGFSFSKILISKF